jgi:hypothetical protein
MAGLINVFMQVIKLLLRKTYQKFNNIQTLSIVGTTIYLFGRPEFVSVPLPEFVRRKGFLLLKKLAEIVN